jgi:hypothetical protein
MTRQCLQDGFRLIDELFGAQEDNPGAIARRECKLRQRCEPPLVTTPTASAPRLAPEGEEILATLERIERIAGYEG